MLHLLTQEVSIRLFLHDKLDAVYLFGDVAIDGCEVARRKGLQFFFPSRISDFHPEHTFRELQRARALGDSASAGKRPSKYRSDLVRDMPKTLREHSLKPGSGALERMVTHDEERF